MPVNPRWDVPSLSRSDGEWVWAIPVPFAGLWPSRSAAPASANGDRRGRSCGGRRTHGRDEDDKERTRTGPGVLFSHKNRVCTTPGVPEPAELSGTQACSRAHIQTHVCAHTHCAVTAFSYMEPCIPSHIPERAQPGDTRVEPWHTHVGMCHQYPSHTALCRAVYMWKCICTHSCCAHQHTHVPCTDVCRDTPVHNTHMHTCTQGSAHTATRLHTQHPCTPAGTQSRAHRHVPTYRARMPTCVRPA